MGLDGQEKTTGVREQLDQIHLSDLEAGVGNAKELTPQERARLSLAMKVLGALALLFVLSGVALLFGPADRLTQAQGLFEFVKTGVLPIATLVLGFYYRSEAA